MTRQAPRRHYDGLRAQPSLRLAVADVEFWTRLLTAKGLRRIALRLDPKPKPPARERTHDPDMHQHFWAIVYGDEEGS